MVREIFESLRLFNRELQRDLLDEEDPHELCIVEEEAPDEIDFLEAVAISDGSTPETAQGTALPTTSSKFYFNHARRSGTDRRSTERKNI